MKRYQQILILITVTLLLSNCGESPDSERSTPDRKYPDQEIWNPVITLTKDGQKRAVVHSGHLVKYNDQAYVNMDTEVSVDFYDINERHLSHLTATEAVVYENTNDLIAKGNVVVTSDSGLTLYTEVVQWNHRREKIISDTYITLVTDQDTLYGVGFESDSDLKNWVIFKPAGVSDRKINLERHE